MLAGISVEYLTRLEQGRDRHPSGQVLAALADALQLNPEQRLHLRWVAKFSSGDGGLCIRPETPDYAVRPSVYTLLDRFEPGAAVVVNRIGDVLAYTSGYRRLAQPLGTLDVEIPNLVRYVFTDPRARAAYPDWEHVADGYFAHARAEFAHPDASAAELSADIEFAAGSAFTDRLTAPPAVPQYAGIERMVHPEAGDLRLAYESLEISGSPGQRLIVHVPADDATALALDRLNGIRPGELRAVREA